MKIKISKELLIKEYVHNNKSVPKLSLELKCACSTIYNKMKIYGIQRRKQWTITDYIGKEFGDWTVLRKDKNKHSTWICKCKCGIEKSVKSCNLLSNSSTKCNNCTKTGCGEITGTRWSNIKNSASQRNLEFSITVQEAWKIFLKQNRKCNLSGTPICFAKRHPTRTASTASLDRIDSKLGYVKNNVQWVYKKINMMKQGYSQQEFITLCKMVAKNNE